MQKFCNTIFFVWLVFNVGNVKTMSTETAEIEQLLQTINSFMTDIANDNTVDTNQQQTEYLLGKIKDVVEANNINLQNYFALQSKIDQLQDLKNLVLSGMKLLQRIVESTNSSQIQENKDRFKEQFVQSRSKFDSLEELLSGVGPAGLNKDFLKLVSDHVNCDVDSLGAFKDYFMKLAKSGAVLEVAYEGTTSHSQYDMVRQEWIGRLKAMNGLFDYQINSCNADNKKPKDTKSSGAAIQVLWTKGLAAFVCVVAFLF